MANYYDIDDILMEEELLSAVFKVAANGVEFLIQALKQTLVGDRSIGAFLLSTFTSRYKEALSKAHSASCSPSPKFLPLLTKEEHQLFETARSSMAAYEKW